MKSYKQIYYSIMALSLCGISFTQAMLNNHTIKTSYAAFNKLILGELQTAPELEAMLLEDVLKKDQINDIDPVDGQTLLTSSIFNNNTNFVELLLKKGANIRQRNIKGETVLHAAVLQGNIALLKRFLELGASDIIEEKDIDGQSIIDMLNEWPDILENHEMRNLLQNYNSSQAWPFRLFSKKGLLIAGGVVAGLFAAYIKYKTPVDIEQKEQEAKEQAE